MNRAVWMAGPALDAPGGMSAVVTSYRDAGLFDAVPVHYLRTYTRPGLAAQLRVFGSACLQLMLALIVRRVRLLHVHSASRGSFWRKSLLCAMARAVNVPYFFHIHSGEFPVFYAHESGRLGQWWIKYTLRGAHMVLVLTPEWAERLQALVGTLRCQVALNPVALPAAPPKLLRVGRSRLLFLGRIRHKKGAFDLLRAFQGMLRQVPHARLVMAGDGEIDAGRALCIELGIAHAVTFTGWIEGGAKDAELSAADVFVLPSYFEGLPIGVLEAMTAGVVVVASRTGGIPDLVADGVEGRLVEPGDIAGLERALIEVTSDDDLGNRWATAAWMRVQLHSASAVATGLENLYVAAATPWER